MRVIFVAVFSFSLLSACAPVTGSPAGEAPTEKQYGGIFVKAPQPVLEGLYWYDRVFGGGSGVRNSLSDISETLITYNFTSPDVDYRNELAPGLAESWKQVDPRTYEFSLRQGVKFHDGEEMTSKDVVFSFERMKEGSGPQVGATREIERVEALGPHSVRFALKQVSPDFITVIGGDGTTSFRVLPAHIAERAGNPSGEALRQLYEKNPAGTGPYKFRSFDYNQVLELERFDGYWKGKPYMEGIRSVQRLDRSGQQAAFIAGKVDFVNLPDKVQYDTVKQLAPQTKKVTYVTSNGVGLEFNLRRKPFDDVRVRRAFHLALDRQALHQAVTFGEGFIIAPLTQPDQSLANIGLHPSDYMKLPGWREQKEQDVAEARRLLAEAGQSGMKLILKYQRGSNHPDALTEPVASQLRQNLGIDITIQPLEDALYLAQVQKDRDFDAVVSVQAAGAGEILSVLLPNKWHPTGQLNYNGYDDPEITRVMDSLRTETDTQKRHDLVRQAQRVIIDKAYYAPLVTLANYNAVQSWVHDFYTGYSNNGPPRNMVATWLDVDKLPADRRGW